ncbi:Cyanovirin-N [Mycena galericulata]|nr:Cyanovirin-N [Mycena galericulata]
MSTFVSFVLAICAMAAVPSVLSATLEKRDNFSGSCSSISISASGALTATCAFDSGTNHSTLQLNQCVGNNNGVLIAGQSGFTSSCTGIGLINGIDLTAQCNITGGIVGSQLNLDTFVSNEHGQLEC